MNAEGQAFAQSLKIEDYEKVKMLHERLRTEYKLKSEDYQSHIDVIPMVKNAFGDFPQLAQNEFTVDQMQSLHLVQDNMNGDIENINLAQSFISEVQSTSERIHDEYKDYWHSPFGPKSHTSLE